MNESLRSSAAHVFVDDIETPCPGQDDVHHLSRVLRLRRGETVSVCDGRGRWRLGRWDESTITPFTDPVQDPEPLEVTVAIAPVKGDRTENAVEMLVEVGATRVILLAPLERSVVRRNAEQTASYIERLTRIARAASAQCRRTWLPVVGGPVTYADLVAGDGVAIAEPGAPPDFSGVTTVIIGPEGGFSPEETALARRRVGLGGTVLRAGTAAVVAATLMVTHQGR